MATIKSFTDISQSKKLAEILPLDTADLCYIAHSELINIHEPFYKKMDKDDIPCWSLAALLTVLPFNLIVDNQRYAFSMVKGFNKNGETYAIKYAIFNTHYYLHLTDFYNNPVDACVAMILKLKEMKLL